MLASGCATGADPVDPWERMNRGTFAFNEAADQYVIEPVAQGFDFVVPDLVETGISNFFENARMPRHVLNNLLQGRADDALFEVFRFALNVMMGVGGVVDVAAQAGWPHYPEDFGLTLGHWGVASGPYLVLPIFGPSTVRGTGGLIVDSASTVYTWFVPFYVPLAATLTDTLNRRAIFLGEIEQSREEAFDFYLFVRSAYLQNREHRLQGGAGDDRSGPFGGATAEEDATAEEEDDLYYFDDLDEASEEAPAEE